MRIAATPRVSVIMPAFNGGRFIGAAISSILAQTYRDFELVVIDDGSTDDTADVVRSFGDARIRLVHNAANCGLSRTRNRGIREARGELLAWRDCDDLAAPRRLEKQVAFLDRNPSFGMVGSWVAFIDEQGTLTGRQVVLNAPPRAIPSLMLFRCAFQQSALTMRRSILPAGVCYDEAYPPLEDFELFVRLMQQSRGWNLPAPLCRYRQHGMNISVRAAEVASAAYRRLAQRQLTALGIDADAGSVDLHKALANMEAREAIDPQLAHEWLRRLLAANRQTQVYDLDAFAYVLVERWLYVCWSAPGDPGRKIERFVRAALLREAALSPQAWAGLSLRNLAKKWRSGRERAALEKSAGQP